MQLHLFSDASNVARGTVCYLRTTISRAEPEAVLDAVKLSRTVKQELDIPNCPSSFGLILSSYCTAFVQIAKGFLCFPAIACNES